MLTSASSLESTRFVAVFTYSTQIFKISWKQGQLCIETEGTATPEGCLNSEGLSDPPSLHEQAGRHQKNMQEGQWTPSHKTVLMATCKSRAWPAVGLTDDRSSQVDFSEGAN